MCAGDALPYVSVQSRREESPGVGDAGGVEVKDIQDLAGSAAEAQAVGIGGHDVGLIGRAKDALIKIRGCIVQRIPQI